jgi:hypothetical protein
VQKYEENLELPRKNEKKMVISPPKSKKMVVNDVYEY